MTRLDDPEVRLLSEAAEPVAPPTAEALGLGRERLRAAIAGRRPARSRRRVAVRIALPVAGVALLTAGVVLIPGVLMNQGTEGRWVTMPPSHQTVRVSPDTVLRAAADRQRRAERDRRPPIPRDDQYIYERTILVEVPVAGGTSRVFHDESWRSVDGKRVNSISERGRRLPEIPVDPHLVPKPTYRKLAKFPTEPDRLLKRLYRKYDNDPMPSFDKMEPMRLDDLYYELTDLLANYRVMPPGLRAAAYDALSTLPGLRTAPASDALGRPGIALWRPSTGVAPDFGRFIFDTKTYAYLGNEWPPAHMPGILGIGGSVVVQITALERWGIADRLREVPVRTYVP